MTWIARLLSYLFPFREPNMKVPIAREYITRDYDYE